MAERPRQGLTKEVQDSFERQTQMKDAFNAQRGSAKQQSELAGAFSKQLEDSDNLDVTEEGKLKGKSLFKVDPKKLPRVVSKEHLRALQKEFADTPLKSYRYHELFIMISRGVRQTNRTPSKKIKKQHLQRVKASRKLNRGTKGHTQFT